MSVGDLDAIQIHESTDSFWADRDLAFVTDEAFQFFIHLLEIPNCRIIATSRVVPSDYLASGGALRPGVRIRLVGALTSNEGGAFLQTLGLAVSRVVAESTAVTLGGHPLALRLLARQAAQSGRARSNLRGWLEHQGYTLANGTGSADIRRRLFSRSAALLSDNARMALVAAGALGGSITEPALFDLLAKQDVAEADVADVIGEVVISGLGLRTPEGDLACHPLAAQAASDHLTEAHNEYLIRQLEKLLRRSFQDIEAELNGYFTWFAEGHVSDRIEAMALCRTLVRLGEFEQAGRIFTEQLALAVRYVIGANFESVELLQAIIDGIGNSSADQYRANLAHHLLMVGRLTDASDVLAAAHGLDKDHEALLAGAELALHSRGRANALRLATQAMHQAREGLAYASGYVYSGLQVLGEKWIVDYNGPSSRFIESVVICARVMLSDGWYAEAALLLDEGLDVASECHYQCKGCLGLLLRCVAELLVARGESAQAVAMEAEGRKWQDSQGKSLQGVFSRVLVAIGAQSEEAPSEQLIESLGDGGFVFYQLVLEAAGHSRSADRQNAARRELHELGAHFVLDFIDCAGRFAAANDQRRALPAAAVARCVGWLIQDRAMRAEEAKRSQGEDLPSGELAARQVLRATIQSRYSPSILASVAAALEGAPGNAPVDPVLANLPVRQRFPLRDREPASPEDERRRLELAVELDPCDAASLRRLADLDREAGEADHAFDLVCRAVRMGKHGFANYNDLVTFTADDRRLAARARKFLRSLAWNDHQPSAAYLALANLERQLGRERAAAQWHKEGLEYPSYALLQRIIISLINSA